MTDVWISVDPGEHVGVALWYGEVGAWASEMSPPEFVDWLWDEPGADLVVYESFRLRGGAMALAQTGSTFPAVEVIGVIRHLCRRREVRLASVEPSQRSSALTRVKACGFPLPRGSAHARDAVAVGVAHRRWTVADMKRLTPLTTW